MHGNPQYRYATISYPDYAKALAIELRNRLAAGETLGDAIRALHARHGLIVVKQAVEITCGLASREAARTVVRETAEPATLARRLG